MELFLQHTLLQHLLLNKVVSLLSILVREDNVKFELNKQIYFDPKESVGVGTLTGTGVGSTIFFSNPGAGITQVFIENRGIFLPNHNLKTGDQVFYNNGGGTSIEVVTDPTTGPNYHDC